MLGRADAMLARRADRAFGGVTGPWTLLGLSCLDLACLAWLAVAMGTTGSWATAALACVVFAARGPAALARARADLRRWPPGAASGRARTARKAEGRSRRGGLAMLATYAAAALAVGVTALVDDTSGQDWAAFGIDPATLTAWRLFALPACTLADLARSYAGCALPPAPSCGRSPTESAA